MDLAKDLRRNVLLLLLVPTTVAPTVLASNVSTELLLARIDAQVQLPAPQISRCCAWMVLASKIFQIALLQLSVLRMHLYVARMVVVARTLPTARPNLSVQLRHQFPARMVSVLLPWISVHQLRHAPSPPRFAALEGFVWAPLTCAQLWSLVL